MSIETLALSIFGGNRAAQKEEEQAAKTLRFVEGNYGDQKAAIAPYQAAGKTGLDALTKFITGGADYIGDNGQAILDKISRDVLGRYAAMGLSDSGPGRAAITDALLRGTRGLRSQLFGEAGTLAGFGSDAISKLIQSGAIANQGVAAARGQIGEAKAFPLLNTINSAYKFESDLQRAAGQAVGGGFK